MICAKFWSIKLDPNDSFSATVEKLGKDYYDLPEAERPTKIYCRRFGANQALAEQLAYRGLPIYYEAAMDGVKTEQAALTA
jgi:hypothetical protein